MSIKKITKKTKSKPSVKAKAKSPTKRVAAKKPVEIVCIIDRSGSMQSIHNDVIGGINTFIKEQQQIKGAANLTLVEFDNEYNVLQMRQNLKNAREMTANDFVPRGMTALNDAIGKTVTSFVDLRKARKINKAIFCIMTDGGENASREFTSKDALKTLTEKVQKDYKWEFVFLGANQDAFAEGSSRGIANNFNFAPTAAGVAQGYTTLSASTRSYRTS